MLVNRHPRLTSLKVELAPNPEQGLQFCLRRSSAYHGGQCRRLGRPRMVKVPRRFTPWGSQASASRPEVGPQRAAVILVNSASASSITACHSAHGTSVSVHLLCCAGIFTALSRLIAGERENRRVELLYGRRRSGRCGRGGRRCITCRRLGPPMRCRFASKPKRVAAVIKADRTVS